MINLDDFNHVLKVEGNLVTVEAGIRLDQLRKELSHHNLSISNLGSIDTQSIPGAIATGTHGNSMKQGLLSDRVESLSLVLANAELVHCNATSNPMLFRAALLSLGALGIIIQVTLRVEDSFNVEWQMSRLSASNILDTCNSGLWTSHDYIRVLLMPYDQSGVLWCADRTNRAVEESQTTSCRTVILNYVVESVLLLCNKFPRLLPWIEKATSKWQYGFGTCSRVNAGVRPAEEVLLMKPMFSQDVNEWALPLSKGPDAITRLLAWLHGDSAVAQIPFSSSCLWVNCPIEVRAVDSTARKNPRPFLDPTCPDEPTIYLNATLHRPYLRDPPCKERYYEAFEWLMRDLGGHPHWAKSFGSMNSIDFCRLYGDDMDKWVQIQREVDPGGMFLGEWHFRNLLIPRPASGNINSSHVNGNSRLPFQERELARRRDGSYGTGDGTEWKGDGGDTIFEV